ncbi:MAG: aspartate kinase [Bacteriovorax sp.]|nr:aspartate kinase [Bacteriovorax sp.]
MKSKWIVSKFGGSSVKDAAAMLRCSQIIENNPLTKIVVISATQNTTNQLEFVARAASMGDEETLNNVTQELINKHVNIAVELFTSPAVLTELEALCGELKALGVSILQERTYTPKMMDELYSLGERMSSLLMSDLLRLRLPKKNINFLDARKIIKTSSDFQRAEPQIDLIQKNAATEIIPHLEEDTLFVTQGFIGADLLGNTTTLGREGSDYSAALFGEAINASLVEIWTDVPGVASSDPRLIENVKFIKELSYDEATALATLGAKVLFPTTLLPTKRKNIPVFVGSSLNPEKGGTMVTSDQNAGFSLKGVSQLVRPEGILVSFIGTHLDEKENLAEILQKDLGENSFEFSDLTAVSISFKVTSNKMDFVSSLKVAHDVLAKFFS